MRNSRQIEENRLNLVLEGLSYEDYAAYDAINAHGLMDVIKSPAFYRANISHESEPTLSMRLGLHVDMALFEPQKFEKAIKVPIVRGQSRMEGQEFVTPAHMARVRSIVSSIYGNEMANELLLRGVPQPTICWADRFHKVHCKARLDFISELGGRRIGVDLKTTADASSDKFARQMAEYRYDLQAAHYLEAARATGIVDPEVFLFIAVQNRPPYDCFVYRAGESVLSRGIMWRDYAMQIYAECRRRGEWPGLPQYQTIELPYWAKPPQEEEQQQSALVPNEPPPEDEQDG